MGFCARRKNYQRTLYSSFHATRADAYFRIRESGNEKLFLAIEYFFNFLKDEFLIFRGQQRNFTILVITTIAGIQY